MWYNAPWNTEIIKFLQSFNSPLLDTVFQGVTALGEEYFYIFALTLIYWCIDKGLGYRIGFSFLSGMTLNSGIKESLMIPRPIGEPGIRSLRIETATGWSFPSGHAQGTTTFWTSIMSNFKGSKFKVLGVLIIIFVAISRLYLGVHRPVDVLGGILIGALWVTIINTSFNYIEKGGSRLILVVFVIPGIAGLLLLKDPDYYKSMGTFLGFLVGFMIEPDYIGYEAGGTLQQNILKFIIGISGVLIIKTGVKLLLPETLLSDLFRYFLIGSWVTLGATSIFKENFRKQTIFMR